MKTSPWMTGEVFVNKMKKKSDIPLFQVGMFTTIRLVLNTAIRMAYPFIPFSAVE